MFGWLNIYDSKESKNMTTQIDSIETYTRILKFYLTLTDLDSRSKNASLNAINEIKKSLNKIESTINEK